MVTMSAERNSQYAQYSLGSCISWQGVPRDCEAAMRVYPVRRTGQHLLSIFPRQSEFIVIRSILAATRLLHHLSRIFLDEQKRLSGGPGMQTDSKLRRRIREKKIAQGHAPDDHELRQTTY